MTGILMKFGKIIFYLFFGLFLIVIGLLFPIWAPFVLYSDTSCLGIDYFYTGEDFWVDVSDFLVLASPNFNDTNDVIEPYEILENKSVDCKSISHTIMCLAEKYGERCVYYTERRYDPSQNWNGTHFNESVVKRFDGSHIGIRCLFGQKWLMLY